MDEERNRQLRRLALLAAAAIAVIGGITAAVAEGTTSHSHAHRATQREAQAAVGVKRNGALGRILDAGSRHLTVYVFAADRGTKSRRGGACASAWPPVTTRAKPRASGGARSAALGTTRRAGGVKQVTYKGHPLYYFQGDRSAQAAAGQGLDAFGARWYVITPAGHAVTKTAATQSTSMPTTSGTQSTTPGYGSTQTTASPTTTTGTPTTTTPTSTDPTTTTSPGPPDEWS
ncbi:MAG TPA: hypothetical protein VHV75_14795 [Solirubrobacteraceae bacterium]|jgi:predicted lipoprotein with Yx(FWY)xxD motif|nr:hypothetical protein [Solirubrobacteraceae bacterium]